MPEVELFYRFANTNNKVRYQSFEMHIYVIGLLVLLELTGLTAQFVYQLFEFAK